VSARLAGRRANLREQGAVAPALPSCRHDPRVTFSLPSAGPPRYTRRAGACGAGALRDVRAGHPSYRLPNDSPSIRSVSGAANRIGGRSYRVATGQGAMINNLVPQVFTAVIGLAIGMVAWNTGVSALNLLNDWIMR